MQTILVPCRVPWTVLPTAWVTLHHTETDVAPECTVVFGGGRQIKRPHVEVIRGGTEYAVDNRRIELEFEQCHYTRTGPEGAGPLFTNKAGYSIARSYDGDMSRYLEWRAQEWRHSGICPDPGFFVAKQSAWLAELEMSREMARHYVVVGRDGHVELIAVGFRWREWRALRSNSENPPAWKALASGEGVD